MDMNALMAMMQRAGAGAAAPRAPPPLSIFRAGRLEHAPSQAGPAHLRLTATKRKGELLVAKQAADGTVHVQWRDRTTGDLGLDIMVFPNDLTFRRITTPGGAKDRVYELRLREGTRQRHFFWLQEPSAAEDDARVAGFLRAVNEPDVVARERAAAAPGGGGAAPSVAPAGGMTPAELERLLAGMAPNLRASPATASVAPVPPASAVAAVGATPAATTTTTSAPPSSAAAGEGGAVNASGISDTSAIGAMASLSGVSATAAPAPSGMDVDEDEELRQALLLSMAEDVPAAPEKKDEGGDAPGGGASGGEGGGAPP